MVKVELKDFEIEQLLEALRYSVEQYEDNAEDTAELGALYDKLYEAADRKSTRLNSSHT